MMVSTRGRYALRLIIDIAKQGQSGALVTMRQSAERLGLSVKYLDRAAWRCACARRRAEKHSRCEWRVLP